MKRLTALFALLVCAAQANDELLRFIDANLNEVKVAYYKSEECKRTVEAALTTPVKQEAIDAIIGCAIELPDNTDWETYALSHYDQEILGKYDEKDKARAIEFYKYLLFF
ncbi:hypothetical protein KRX19_06265 [Cardiobacteriaceae bacterium TAE3-ERU3]|nr:hypothetical protein [Cardiobacteriaceae bacterium TAE3-ERU3]